MRLINYLKRLQKHSDKEARILILGLDNGGKSTILKKFNNEEITHVMPTEGFNVKSLTHGKSTFLRFNQ